MKALFAGVGPLTQRDRRMYRSALITLTLLATIVSAAGGQDKRLCVTVDDLPAVALDRSYERFEYITTRLISIFDRYQVPAIGFVNEGKLFIDGKRDPNLEDLLRKWMESGYELGNHTFGHVDYHRVSISRFEDHIRRGEGFTNSLFAGDTGRIRYFRHPFLHTGNSPEKRVTLDSLLATLNYTVAPVTIDNSDWIFSRAYDLARNKRDSAMLQRIAGDYIPYMVSKVKYYERQSSELFNRMIPQVLLIHANTLNADLLDDLLTALVKDDYKFISISGALADDAYSARDEYYGVAGISWIQRWAITAKKPNDFFAGEPKTPAYILQYAGVEAE